ncbi:hypothetical protein BH23VER1_BH23VER1_06160 [soil metagenome]
MVGTLLERYPRPAKLATTVRRGDETLGLTMPVQ